MKKSILILSLLCSSPAFAMTFNEFIGYLNSLPDSLRPAAVDSFIQATDSFPFVEGDTLAHFIYNNSASSVSVPGDFNNWNSNADAMSHVWATNLWYRTKTFEADARLDYKFVINGSNWILDPLNPHTCIGGFGPNSELAMPQYVQPPEIQYYPDIPHGILDDTVFYSQYMGNSRTIKVYLPPGYETSGENYPVILFHDGLEYISLAYGNRVLDYCIYHQLCAPAIGVFVPPVNRTPEYAGNLQDEFAQFITQEVIPWVDGRYRTMPDAAHRATIGASYGGNIALYLSMMFPNVFSMAAPVSPWVQPSLIDSLSYGQMHDWNFYFDAGTYEDFIIDPLEADVIPLLEARNFNYQYSVYHEGHSWGNWRAHIDNALIRFFPGTGGEVRSRYLSPKSPVLLQCYPNPFNGTVQVKFTLSGPGLVTIAVYNIIGEKVAEIYSGDVPAGENVGSWDAKGMSSGIYYLQMRTEYGTEARKVLLLK